MAKRKSKTAIAKTPQNDRPEGDDPQYYYRRTWKMINDGLRASLDRCLKEMKSGRTENGERSMGRMQAVFDALTSALDKSDLWRSVYWALRFGSLTDSIVGWDAAEALWRERKKDRGLTDYRNSRKKSRVERSEVVRDRKPK